jgi:hypothetical protein
MAAVAEELLVVQLDFELAPVGFVLASVGGCPFTGSPFR